MNLYYYFKNFYIVVNQQKREKGYYVGYFSCIVRLKLLS